MSATSGKAMGHHGFVPPGLRPDYKTYVSPHAPSYKVSPNFHGINYRTVSGVGGALAAFGVTAGIAAVFFLSDVPRVRIDIMQKLPVIGPYFEKSVAPEDNPF